MKSASRPLVLRFVLVLAAVAWCTAGVLSVRAIRAVDATARVLRERMVTIRDLQRLQGELAGYEAAREAVRASLPPAAGLADVLAAALPGVRPELAPERVVAESGGCVCVEQEVSLVNVPVAGVFDALRRIEAQRPAMAVTACDINALPSPVGTAQVRLVVRLARDG